MLTTAKSIFQFFLLCPTTHFVKPVPPRPEPSTSVNNPTQLSAANMTHRMLNKEGNLKLENVVILYQSENDIPPQEITILTYYECCECKKAWRKDKSKSYKHSMDTDCHRCPNCDIFGSVDDREESLGYWDLVWHRFGEQANGYTLWKPVFCPWPLPRRPRQKIESNIVALKYHKCCACEKEKKPYKHSTREEVYCPIFHNCTQCRLIDDRDNPAGHWEKVFQRIEDKSDKEGKEAEVDKPTQWGLEWHECPLPKYTATGPLV